MSILFKSSPSLTERNRFNVLSAGWCKLNYIMMFSNSMGSTLMSIGSVCSSKGYSYKSPWTLISRSSRIILYSCVLPIITSSSAFYNSFSMVIDSAIHFTRLLTLNFKSPKVLLRRSCNLFFSNKSISIYSSILSNICIVGMSN